MVCYTLEGFTEVAYINNSVPFSLFENLPVSPFFPKLIPFKLVSVQLQPLQCFSFFRKLLFDASLPYDIVFLLPNSALS